MQSDNIHGSYFLAFFIGSGIIAECAFRPSEVKFSTSCDTAKMCSGAGGLPPLWQDWCQEHCAFCGNFSPLQKWRRFCKQVKGMTAEEAVSFVPRFRSCPFRATPADFFIQQRALTFLRFASEKRRLLRQMTCSHNVLSEKLPAEIVNPLARLIVREMQPSFSFLLEYFWKGVVLASDPQHNDVLDRHAKARRMERLAQRSKFKRDQRHVRW
jgi:hypothetical protein